MGAYLGLVGPGVPILGAFMFNAIYKIPAYRFTAPTSSPPRRSPTPTAAPVGPEATFAHRADDGRGRASSSAWSRWSSARRTGSTTRSSRSPRSQADLRHGQLRAGHRPGHGHVRLRRPAARAGGAPRAATTRSSSASASRPSPRCAASRPRGVLGSLDYGAGGWEAAGIRMLATGKVEVITGGVRARAGPRDGVQPDRRRPARACRSRTSRSSTATPRSSTARAWTPTARARWSSAASRSSRRPRRSSRRPSRSPRTCSRPPRTTSSSPPATSPSGAPTRAWASRTWRSPRSAAHDMPEGIEPDIDAHATFDPENFSYPHGTHLCAVEVDTETGPGAAAQVRLRGRRRHGRQPADRRGPGPRRPRPGHRAGALRGGRLRRARARCSPARWSTTRCPRRRTCPASTRPPSRRPSTTNPLGVKGVGEAGTIASTPAVVNAVLDACASRRHGHRHADHAPPGVDGPSRTAKGTAGRGDEADVASPGAGLGSIDPNNPQGGHL